MPWRGEKEDDSLCECLGEERRRTTHSVRALERRERGRLTLCVPWRGEKEDDSLCECLGEERKRTTHSVSALERRERGRLTL